jgi:hypothetical protein
MNTNKDDGGHAFPADASTNLFSRGMTLRDYFAAKAMQGLMGRSWCDAAGNAPDNIYQIWSESAYAIADAMLKARQS